MKIGDFETHPAADAFPMLEGDAFDALVEDIKSKGLEHAIVYVVDGKRQLILDGRNRLKACIRAKVKAVFTAYKGKDPIGFVVSQNLARRHMDESQRALVAARLEKLTHGGDRSKMPIGMKRADAAKAMNVSVRSVARAHAVLERAEPKVVERVERGEMAVSAAADVAKLPASEQNEIAERSKGKHLRTGHVRALVRQHERRAVVKKINAGITPLPLGPFRVIVTDFPWPYENGDDHAGSRGHMPYPPMSIDEICELGARVDQVVHHDGAIWFGWVTNAFVWAMPRIVKAWGFEWFSMGTWTKSKAGMGSGPRGRTEHYVIAMRGKPIHTLNETSTWLGDRVIDVPREHSRKPEPFYEMVEKHCPGPRLELFAREPRKGWARWGAESEKFTTEAA